MTRRLVARTEGMASRGKPNKVVFDLSTSVNTHNLQHADHRRHELQGRAVSISMGSPSVKVNVWYLFPIATLLQTSSGRQRLRIR